MQWRISGLLRHTLHVDPTQGPVWLPQLPSSHLQPSCAKVGGKTIACSFLSRNNLKVADVIFSYMALGRI